MPGIENLFATEPTLPNVQGHKMPENSERWAEVLTTYLREQFPDTAHLPVTVEFRKKEEQIGTAIGAIHVTNPEVEKAVTVPFIIKDFMLSPLDIWMEPKTQVVHPMDKDTFKEQFFAQSFAEGTYTQPGGPAGQLPGQTFGSPDASPNMWQSSYAPGRYSYASAGYPILDNLSDTFHREEAAEFRKTLQDYPSLLIGFKKHGHAEIIKTLASKHYKPAPDIEKIASDIIPPLAISLKKEASDLFSVISMEQGHLDLAKSIRMDRADCEQFISKFVADGKELMDALEPGNEKTIQIRAPRKGVFLMDDLDEVPVAANEFAAYRVKTHAGMQENGAVIPMVVGFDGKRKNLKLFVGKGHFACQASIAGLQIDDKNVVRQILKPEDIHTGQTGFFIHTDGIKAVATLPLTVTAIENFDEIIGTDYHGRKVRVRRGYGTHFGQTPPAFTRMAMRRDGSQKTISLESMGFAETRPGHFTIPSKMLWIRLGTETNITETKSEWLQKEAFTRMDSNPLTIRWTGIVYEIDGAGLTKNAYDERTSDLLMAGLGIPMEKIARAKKRARTIGRAKVHGVEGFELPEFSKEARAKELHKIAHTAQALRRNLLKEASEIDNAPTVDALLSLNFLNAENLARFASYRPIFEKVSDYLAELVLSSRLGLKEVNEAAAVSAMSKLQEVTDGLKRITVSMGRPSTKTASGDMVEALQKKKKKGTATQRYVRSHTKSASPHGLVQSSAMRAAKIQRLKDFAKASPENAAKLKQLLGQKGRTL